MKLDLGCGPTPSAGHLGVDIIGFPNVQCVDLRIVPWPFRDETCEHIIAHDILEHLPDKNGMMYEIERILIPGSDADILVPDAVSAGAFQDPTHVSFWTQNSFAYYSVDHQDYLRLNQRYGYRGRGFHIIRIGEILTQGPYTAVKHVHVVLRKPG